MQVPLELSFHQITNTPDVESLIRTKANKLEKFCDHINSCRVAVEKPNEFVSSGSGYRVRIDLTVPPGHELVVREEPGDGGANDSLHMVINRAFDAAERQLKKLNDQQHGKVKAPSADIQNAFVVRMFKDQDYGFLKTPEEREIYFHRNSVPGKDWDFLTVGTQVRFEETMGEMGPQATTVKIIDKPGVRSANGAAEGETDELEVQAG